MVSFDPLRVPIIGDPRHLQRTFARTRGQTSAFARGMSADIQRIDRRTQSLRASAASATVSLGRMFGIIGGVAAGRGLVKLADASTRIDNALKVAGLSGEELTRVFDRLFETAQRNAVPIESLAQLYGRVALVQNELNISTEELLNFTDKVAVALRVSGQSAEEARGALLQLTQALGSGVVRAEEFNSILEGALPVAQAAAAGLEEAGGSVAKLRQLVIDGAVSSEAFFRAFEAGSVILDEKVGDSVLTVSQGFVRLHNVLIASVGSLDEASGASTAAAAALNLVADALNAATAEDSTLIRAIDETASGFAELNRLANQLANNPNFTTLADFLFGTDFSGGRALAAVEGAKFDQLRNSADERIRQMRGDAPRVSLSDFDAPGGDDGSSGGRGSGASRIRREARLIGDEFERSTELARFFGETTADAFGAVIPSIETGNEALNRFLNTLIEAVTQAALLGSGPLAGLFARGAGGGLLGSVFGFGGPVVGAGIGLFAQGGVTDRPAIFGEGPMREAAVPLPDGHSIPVKFEGMGVGAMMQGHSVVELRLADDIDARIERVSGPIAVRVTKDGLGRYERAKQRSQSTGAAQRGLFRG